MSWLKTKETKIHFLAIYLLKLWMFNPEIVLVGWELQLSKQVKWVKQAGKTKKGNLEYVDSVSTTKPNN